MTAFARYEDGIRSYVRSAQELPPGGVSGYAPMTAPMIWARGLSMRWMTRWPMRPVIARQFAKAADIELPEYAFASVG